MNLLTGTDVLVEDKLFATLDTRTARWNLGEDQHTLLSDTVGFVRDLPHHLVASFRATLEEAIHADLLLHVVDLSHSQAEQQMLATNKVLKEIGCSKKDIILIFNKIDRADKSLSDTMKTLYPDALCLSAHTGQGVEQLVREVKQRDVGRLLHLKITCSYADGRAASFLRTYGTVIAEEFNEDSIALEAHLDIRQLGSLKRLAPLTCELIGPLNQSAI